MVFVFFMIRKIIFIATVMVFCGFCCFGTPWRKYEIALAINLSQMQLINFSPGWAKTTQNHKNHNSGSKSDFANYKNHTKPIQWQQQHLQTLLGTARLNIFESRSRQLFHLVNFSNRSIGSLEELL